MKQWIGKAAQAGASAALATSLYKPLDLIHQTFAGLQGKKWAED